MKKLSLIILTLLIPAVALGDVMIFFVAEPEVVVTRLGNLRARPNLGAGVKAKILESAIIVATEPEYLGAGLDEVKAKDPDVFDLITVQEVDDGKGKKKVVGMGAKPKGAETVLSVRAAHTFAGFDPMTGEKS